MINQLRVSLALHVFGKIEKKIDLVAPYLHLCRLNLTVLSTAAMMKNMSIGSNRMYWEMVIQPVSVGRVKLSTNAFPLLRQDECMLLGLLMH